MLTKHSRWAVIIAIVAASLGCGASGQRHVLPQGLIGVGFSGIDTATLTPITLATAKVLRGKARSYVGGGVNAEGREHWFFHAFDRESLDFFVGRFHMKCQGRLGCMEYVVSTIYRVPRSRKAVRELSVEHDVTLWETGIRGVRGGMSEAEVSAVLGKPASTQVEQYVGSLTWVYPQLRVTFLAWHVAFVHEMAASPSPEK